MQDLHSSSSEEFSEYRCLEEPLTFDWFPARETRRGRPQLRAALVTFSVC